MRKRSVFARATAAALLAGALVMGPLGLAPAGADLSEFSATGTGFGLRVTVDFSGLPDDVKAEIDSAYTSARDALPAEAQAELPESFPFVVDQFFARTTSDANQVGDGFSTKAESVLGDGFADLDSVTAESVGESKQSSTSSLQIPPSQAGLDASVVNGAVGDLLAQVDAGPVVDADASLAEVNVTLVNAIALLPDALRDPLTDALLAVVDEVNSTLDGASGTLSDTVEDTADEVEGTLAGSPLGDTLADAGVIDEGGVVDDGTDLSTNVLDALGAIEVASPVTNTLATMADVQTQANAHRADGDVVSTDAHSVLKSVDVLGGFLSVDAIDLESHSEAAGTEGSAHFSGSCSLTNVRLGDAAGVSLDGTTLYVEVDGEPVAVPVETQDTIDTLKGEVDSLLAQAGVSVELCSDTKTATGAGTGSAADDGTSASHSVSAFIVTIEPTVPEGVDVSALGLNEGDSLFKVVLDPTVQTAVSAQQAQAVPTALPRTGAGVLGTVLSGLLLTGGAFAIRRRMR